MAMQNHTVMSHGQIGSQSLGNQLHDMSEQVKQKYPFNPLPKPLQVLSTRETTSWKLQ